MNRKALITLILVDKSDYYCMKNCFISKISNEKGD